MRIALSVLALASMSFVAHAKGTYVNVVDDHVSPARGPLQLAAVEFGLAPNGSEELICAIYAVNEVAAKDAKRAVALADQAFEEVLGAHCTRGAYRRKRDGLVYGVSRCYIYIGPRIPGVYLRVAKDALFAGVAIQGSTLVASAARPQTLAMTSSSASRS